jgi:sporulation protein YlmC with PRC-barrel domain
MSLAEKWAWNAVGRGDLETMRLKELRGLPVIDPNTARKIGTVVDFQVDPATGHVAALDISVPNSDGERVLGSRIRRVGRSAVILTAHGGAEAGIASDVDERWLDASTLGGLEVIGDDGNRVGRLADARFNQESLEIEVYLLRLGILQRAVGRRGRIPPARVQSCSRELMLVTSGRLTDVAQVTPALEEATTLGLRTPLKTDDRLPAPSFEQVPDGQTVGARTA